MSRRALNEAFLSQATPQGLNKQAQDDADEFIRMRMREDGFWRRILEPEPLGNDELDKSVDTDKPVKIIEKEPNSPAAISIPFGMLPQNRYIRAPKIRVMFDRIVTPRFMKDVDELRTYDYDIRQILSDNAIKDMLAEEDGKAIQTVDAALFGPNVFIPEAGTALWVTINGGITRSNLAEGMKTMPKSNAHITPAKQLVNNVTIWDIVKFDRPEIGGDLAEELMVNGLSERQIMGVDWIITIKRDLVGDGTFYQFAEKKFLGKFYVLEDATLYVKREAYMLEFFAYELIGSVIGNIAAIARIDYIL